MAHLDDHSQDELPPSEEGQRRLATIMFSDICGYTRMMGKNEARTLQIVQRNLEIHQRLLKKYNGTLVKEMGDGLLTSFDSPSDAVNCAKEILAAVSNEEGLELHIGIHQGEVIFTENDVYGDGVNITARIDSEAWPGEVLISEDIWKNIRNKKEIVAISIGRRHLKNVEGTIELFRVLLTDEDDSDQYKQFVRRRKAPILRLGLIAVAGLVIVAAFFLWYDVYYGTPDEYKSIAILPFQNETNNQEFDYLSEGLADDVIKQFSHLSALSVISSRSSFQFKDSDKTINQLSKSLKADLIMDGSYSIEGDLLKVKVELIAGGTNEIICYASPIANLNEVKSIAAKIEREVFKVLRILVSAEDKTRRPETRNVNIEAYKYYALGKSALRDNTLQDREDIIQYFKAAIQLDSTFIDPYLGLAEAYFFDVNRGYMSSTEAATHIRKYALAAEHIKPGAGEVQGLLGGLYCLEYNFKEALIYLENSINISPNYDFTYSFYSYSLLMVGQFEESKSIVDKAMILDPLNSFYSGFKVSIDIYQRNYREAIEDLEEQLLLNPDHKHTLFYLGVANLENKDYSSAYKVFLKRGVGLKTNFAVGYTYAKLGMKEEALVVLNHLLSTEYVPPVQIAILYVGLEQYDEALEQIEKSYLIRDSWFLWIKYSGLLDPIRDDPRFMKVVEMLDSH